MDVAHPMVNVSEMLFGEIGACRTMCVYAIEVPPANHPLTNTFIVMVVLELLRFITKKKGMPGLKIHMQ